MFYIKGELQVKVLKIWKNMFVFGTSTMLCSYHSLAYHFLQ